MQAYHNEPAIKEKFIKRVQDHRAADELVHSATVGRLPDGSFRGCAVVCTMETYSHCAYETEIGVPRVLAKLEDGIFEGLPQKEAMDWPEQFLQAIPVGADLAGVLDKFLHWMLVDPQDGVIQFAKTDRTRKAIRDIASLHERKIRGETINREEWEKTAAAADAAGYAAYAAHAYAYAAAYAGYAAAYAAHAAYADAYAYSADAADAYAYAAYADDAAAYSADAADAYAYAAAFADDAAAAYAAAYAAYAADAYAYAYAAAYSADAADAYAYAAFADDAAASADDAYATRQAARKKQAAKLIELLKAAPVPVKEAA